jgi:hypothetical protein
MRTTVTLDPDVLSAVRRLMREGNLSFKEAVNTAIRAGLQVQRQPKPFRQKTFRMGQRARVDLTKALDLAATLEDEAIRHKLDVRK